MHYAQRADLYGGQGMLIQPHIDCTVDASFSRRKVADSDLHVCNFVTHRVYNLSHNVLPGDTVLSIDMIYERCNVYMADRVASRWRRSIICHPIAVRLII